MDNVRHYEEKTNRNEGWLLLPNAQVRREVCLAVVACDSLLVVARDSFQMRHGGKERKRREGRGKGRRCEGRRARGRWG